MTKINVDDSGIDDTSKEKADNISSDELKDISEYDKLYEQGIGKSVDDNVYMPQDDTYLLCDAVDEFAKGKVLEIGCGSGFISCECAKNGLDVTCVDINPYAVEETKRLASQEGVKINCFVSDLFENVLDEYDTIIFNPPYLPEDETEPNDLVKIATTGGMQGHEVISAFFDEVLNFLKNDGQILILFSSLTDKKKIDEMIHLYGYKKELVREKAFFFETLYVYRLTRL